MTEIVSSQILTEHFSAALGWRFELANSSDLSLLGELTQARGRTLSLALNRPGAFSFTLPLEDQMAELVQELTTCVIVKRQGTVVWSGPVFTIEEATPNTISVGCVGWLQTLEKRLTRASWGNPLIFQNADAGEIAMDLVGLAIAEAARIGSPVFVFIGEKEETQLRDKSFLPHTPILPELYNLAAIESGFDMLVDPVTRELNIYSKLMTDRPDAVFEWGRNINSIGRSSDSTRICNRMVVLGGQSQTAVAEDLTSQLAYGLIEEVSSLSDVTDAVILQAFAEVEVLLRATPLRTHTFEPRKAAPGSTSDALLFRDFFLGDKVYLTVKKGRLDISHQAVRLFSVTVTFDELGNEQMTSVSTVAEGS